jgi:hypothetical protein
MDDSQSPPLPNSGYRDTLVEPIEPRRGTRDHLKAFENLRDQQYGEQNIPSTSMIVRQWDETVLGEPLGNCPFVRG